MAIIDPMLTVSCPPSVTASSGLDAFIHAAEPFLSENANPITDAIALDAISIITRWLGPAFADGKDREARYYMALGSLMAGMVLSNAGTSLVHAMAYPVGGEHHTPHGVSLSVLMLACFDYIAVTKEAKMALLAEAMGEPIEGLPPRKVAPQVLDAIRHLIKSVNLPASLADLNIDRKKTNVHQWAIEAHREQRLLTRSPRILSVEDIEIIYENAFKQ